MQFPGYSRYRNKNGPILQAQRRKHAKPATNISKQHQSYTRPLIALAASLFVLYLFYLTWRSPSSKHKTKDHTIHPPIDTKEELRLLNEAPSEHACQRPRPTICAHGGDPTIAPPNTLRAFQSALENGGVDCVEVDVSMTKDGYLIVLHNRELEILLNDPPSHLLLSSTHSNASSGTTSNSNTPPPLLPTNRKLANVFNHKPPPIKHPLVPEMTWEQLRTLTWQHRHEAAAPGDTIQLFEDILSLAMQHQAWITIDVKLNDQGMGDVAQDVESMAQAVVDALRLVGCNHRCLVWAKSDTFIVKIRELWPELRTGYVVFNDTEEARSIGMHKPFRLPTANVMAVHWSMATPSLVTQAHAVQKQVHVWTANTPTMMRAALDSGAHGIVTSYPREVVKVVDRRRDVCWKRQQRHAG